MTAWHAVGTRAGASADEEGSRQRQGRAEVVRRLSDRLVALMRPVRCLGALGWGEEVERRFLAGGGREMPRVTAEHYAARPLPFDPAGVKSGLRALGREVEASLGRHCPAGRLLARRCEEQRRLVAMLEGRGTPALARASAGLYGTAGERVGGASLAALAWALAHGPAAPPEEERGLSAADAARELSERLAPFFGGPQRVSVKLAGDLAADAAAGRDYIKVRQGARFSPGEVRLLEAHEGWAHLGTSLNGHAQPVCTFLGQCSPSATVTQEGLAVLTELLALACSPARLRRLAHRVLGIALAEAGADFLDVHGFFLGQGHDERGAYQLAMRVFRGSLPSGCGPFTKDLSYLKGLVRVAGFARAALAAGRGELVPLLFCGKTALEDVPDLAELEAEGLLAAPRYLPPPFANLGALGAWLDAA